jgi:hypothetical protein
MELYCYDLMFEDIHHRVENQLFAATLADALDFFDGYYLRLHKEVTEKPNALILRRSSDDGEIARYEMHFDVVSGS